MGTSPNDGRIFRGETLNSNTMRNTAAELTEATVVELNDGTLKMFMRNRSGHVQFSTSKDGGATWGAVEQLVIFQMFMYNFQQFTLCKMVGSTLY